MKINYSLLVNLIASAFILSSCSKQTNSVTPAATPVSSNSAIQGKWTLTNISGEIDSTSTLNGATNYYLVKTQYDSVKLQITQDVNGIATVYPYKQTLELDGDGSDIITEAITQDNGANVLTGYAYSYNSYWSLASNLQTYKGLNILGYEKTHIFGNKASIASENAAPGSIQYLLANPLFGSYDLSSTRLVLYLHLEYTGNPDVVTNDVVTNPSISLTADYTISYKKSG